MTQRSTHVLNFFVVRWGVPEPADCAAIRREVPEIRARVGRRLIYLAIVPPEVPTLAESERKLFGELTEAVLPDCERLTLVLEVGGVRGVILRSAMTAVTLLSRRHNAIRVVDSIASALEQLDGELPPLPMVRQALREVGAEPPDSSRPRPSRNGARAP